jgi:hypothetical protein
MSAFSRRLGLSLFVAVLSAAPASAQTATATFSANLAGFAKFSLSSNTVTFPDADPDTIPLVPASSGPLTITVKARATAGSTIRLTISATDSLRSGVNTIPATALTWTTTGSGYTAGTVSQFAAQTLGTWTGPGVQIGTQSYLFQNSWTYVPGTYTLVLFYTLTAP